MQPKSDEKTPTTPPHEANGGFWTNATGRKPVEGKSHPIEKPRTARTTLLRGQDDEEQPGDDQ